MKHMINRLHSFMIDDKPNRDDNALPTFGICIRSFVVVQSWFRLVALINWLLFVDDYQLKIERGGDPSVRIRILSRRHIDGV